MKAGGGGNQMRAWWSVPALRTPGGVGAKARLLSGFLEALNLDFGHPLPPGALGLSPPGPVPV